MILVVACCSVSLVRGSEEKEDEVSAAAPPTPPHKLPGVVRLTDETFEHSTQASTGQTTGSWLVWFYDGDHDKDSAAVKGAFPSEGEWLEDHVVVGSVDAVNEGPKVRERFGIHELPVFVYFHKGHLYRYPIPGSAGTADDGSYAWDALRSFCQNPDPSLAEAIAAPPSFLDDLLAQIKSLTEKYAMSEEVGGKFRVFMVTGLVVGLVVGLFVKALIGHFGGREVGKGKDKKD